VTELIVSEKINREISLYFGFLAENIASRADGKAKDVLTS
jgi:hypothetical protein